MDPLSPSVQSIAPPPTLASIPPEKVLGHIFGERFVKARQEGRATAWLQLQADLSHAANSLVPNIIPLKDFIATMQQIEEFIKDSGGASGKSPSEMIREFLLTNEVPPPEIEPLVPNFIPPEPSIAAFVEETLDTEPDYSVEGQREGVPGADQPPQPPQAT